MKGLISKVVLLAVLCVSLGGLAAAQFGTVRGVCKDGQGTVIVGAQVVWKNQNNGRTYRLKTDKKGSYFSLGVETGYYTVTLSKDDQVLDEQKKVHVGLDELVYDIDLKQAREQSVADTAKKEGKSATEVKQQLQQQQAEAEKTKQYNENVKLVNDKLTAATELMRAKNYPQAIATFQEATTVLPDNDVVWYRLGNAYMESASAQTDPVEKKKQNSEAYTDLQKAVDMKKALPTPTDPARAEKAKRDLAAYYDNLGSTAGRLGKTDEAVADYEQAAELDPPNANQYLFREGVALYNVAMDDASRKKTIAIFDQVIAADPTKAEAYYLKGATLFAMMTMKADGTPVPAPGTIEALQKYLELQPSGGYAEQAKGMLQALNQKVETGVGASKKKK